MAGLVSFISVVASAWTFESAPLSAVPATGRETAPEVFEMRVPDRGGCGWRTTTAAVRPRGGVRFRATAEIALYESLGYLQVGRRPNYYHKPKEDALILRKEWSL